MAGRYRVTGGASEEWASGADRLMVGVLYERDMDTPRWAEAVSGSRVDGEGEFRVDVEQCGEARHAYVFFGRKDGTAFSPSVHVALPG